jgi:hypothetical protein
MNGADQNEVMAADDGGRDCRTLLRLPSSDRMSTLTEGWADSQGIGSPARDGRKWMRPDSFGSFA